MKYKLTKITNHTQKSYGKYVAKTIHSNTITAKQLEEEIQHNCSAKKSDCQLVLCELADTIIHHLQAGDKVELPFLGTIKLEIESTAVDKAEDFEAEKHIKTIRPHFLPKQNKSNKNLYANMNLIEEK